MTIDESRSESVSPEFNTLAKDQFEASKDSNRLEVNCCIRYSFILPTYRRPDVLKECLNHLLKLEYPLNAIEIRVYDNGSPNDSREIVNAFTNRFPNLTYTLNEPGHGLGYSLCRGQRESVGERIVEMNDDALVPSDLLRQFDEVFNEDQTIGVIGVRALEDQYYSHSTDEIGSINPNSGGVVGNFDRITKGPVDVDHLYGFCYVYKREVVLRGGTHDTVLLSKDYSSGNRLETDHCLTAKRLGFRVVYDGRIAVRHLAKPRADMSERSLRWKTNDVRNTLYLYLKHFGLFGRQGLALRYTFIRDVGLISAIRQPTRANWAYFFTGLRARASAYFHYLKYLCTRRSTSFKSRA